MAKNNRPEIENPLAGMGLDDLVRGFTANDTVKVREERNSEPEVKEEINRPEKSAERSADLGGFGERLERYTGISEQGVAIWLPKEVKKQLEMIRINASKNIPLRSLAAAIIMTYISEHEDELAEL